VQSTTVLSRIDVELHLATYTESLWYNSGWTAIFLLFGVAMVALRHFRCRHLVVLRCYGSATSSHHTSSHHIHVTLLHITLTLHSD
jgi:hypothetical protein